jgi:hypothetical protein
VPSCGQATDGCVKLAGEPETSAQPLVLGPDVAGRLRLPTGHGGPGHCSLEHDRHGRARLGLGLMMATTGSGPSLGPL